MENQESTKRQYALRQKAISLGWQEEGYDDFDQIIKDSDEDVQAVLNLIFGTYARFHSCQRTLKELRAQHVLFPKKDRTGYNRYTLQWRMRS